MNCQNDDDDKKSVSNCMWHQLSSSILWLHQPDHVVKFQRRFGVLPFINTHQTKATSSSSSSNVDSHRHHERKVTYDANVLDECLAEIQHSHDQAQGKTKKSNEIDYQITTWFWYYFFQFGAALGNEIFYILFFPIWIWNVDAVVARQVAILWAFFMYVGQATKDVLKIPRPKSPPVLQIEKRYAQEYGFPSTHAMFATGIPLSLVLLSFQRHEFNLCLGLTCAGLIFLWVSLSRIYLGMHSFLDIIGGAFYALLIIYLLFPFISTIDDFQLTFPLSPLVNFLLGILLIKCYPSLKQWSTARSDTTVILGSVFGFYSAVGIMNQYQILDSLLNLPTDAALSSSVALCLLRTIIGLFIVFATRQIVKTVVLRFTCFLYKLDWTDPQIKRLAHVEMPYYYFTYLAVGFNIALTCPYVFQAIGIAPDIHQNVVF